MSLRCVSTLGPVKVRFTSGRVRLDDLEVAALMPKEPLSARVDWPGGGWELTLDPVFDGVSGEGGALRVGLRALVPELLDEAREGGHCRGRRGWTWKRTPGRSMGGCSLLPRRWRRGEVRLPGYSPGHPGSPQHPHAGRGRAANSGGTALRPAPGGPRAEPGRGRGARVASGDAGAGMDGAACPAGRPGGAAPLRGAADGEGPSGRGGTAGRPAERADQESSEPPRRVRVRMWRVPAPSVAGPVGSASA